VVENASRVVIDGNVGHEFVPEQLANLARGLPLPTLPKKQLPDANFREQINHDGKTGSNFGNGNVRFFANIAIKCLRSTLHS